MGAFFQASKSINCNKIKGTQQYQSKWLHLTNSMLRSKKDKMENIQSIEIYLLDQQGTWSFIKKNAREDFTFSVKKKQLHFYHQLNSNVCPITKLVPHSKNIKLLNKTHAHNSEKGSERSETRGFRTKIIYFSVLPNRM